MRRPRRPRRPPVIETVSRSPDATGALARELAALTPTASAILLFGPLGAGKSVFARAFVRAWLGEPDAEVPSPTFTLVQPYEGARGAVWHCDLYRLGEPGELAELGLEEAGERTVLLVEWPERMANLVPEDRLELHLGIDAGAPEGARRVTLIAHGRWYPLLETFASGWGARLERVGP